MSPRLTLARSVGWRETAACAGAELDLFFPLDDVRDARSVETARTICRGCPVRQQCLDWSIDIGESYGIFGGLTASERRALRHTARFVS